LVQEINLNLRPKKGAKENFEFSDREGDPQYPSTGSKGPVKEIVDTIQLADVYQQATPARTSRKMKSVYIIQTQHDRNGLLLD